jgi:hypothetical protein
LPIGENSPNLVTLNIVKQLQGQSSEKIFYFRSDRIFHFLRRRCKCFAQLSDIDFAFLAIVFTRKKFKKKKFKKLAPFLFKVGSGVGTNCSLAAIFQKM